MAFGLYPSNNGCPESKESGCQDPGSPRILGLPGPESWIYDAGSCSVDMGSWKLDPGCGILDAASKIQVPGSRNQDSGSCLSDPGSRILDPSGFRALDPESLIPGPASRISYPGCSIWDPGSSFQFHVGGYRSWVSPGVNTPSPSLKT